VTVPTKYRKKPVVIEAMFLSADTVGPSDGLSPHEESHARIAGWFLGNGFKDFRVVGERRPFGIEIQTLEGAMIASPGDYIIQGIQGEFYPCKPDIFRDTYEAVA